jgi:Uma2 family endonuclease
MPEIAREREPWIGDPLETYEIINGEVVADPYLHPYESWFASKLFREMVIADPSESYGIVIRGVHFVLAESPRLWRRPDLAFVSHERWPVDRPVPRTEAWHVVPDLAAEIVSKADSAEALLARLEDYLRAGIRLVWVVYPDQSLVYAYNSATSVKILQVGDELVGEPILPGFRFPLANLFETTEDGPSPPA